MSKPLTSLGIFFVVLVSVCAALQFLPWHRNGWWRGSTDAETARTSHNILKKVVGDDEIAQFGRDTDYTYKSVCLVDGKPTLVDGFDCRHQVAVGRYKNAINMTGWSYLEIETKPEADPDMQAYAAGVLEGILTHRVLDLHLKNVIYDYCTDYQTYCNKLKAYLEQNLAYVQERLEKAPEDDAYWQGVKRAYLQVTGVWHGFSGAPFNVSIDYSLHPILMLETKFNRSKDPKDEGTGGRCSGLVKVAPNNADILFSQVTMCGFESLLRVLKLYKFGYDRALYPGHTTTISSYPGLLYSADDFALLSSGLATLETTMKIFNNTLLGEITPKGVLHCWVRAIVSNQMARTAREWCHIFKRYNSGTYNNQWLIVDYNKFKPGKELPEHGLFYVLEQMPTLVLYQDLTQLLKEKRYFASYNIPFFTRISRISGFEQKGNDFYWFSWKTCPRAKIFARDQHTVVDLDSLTKLMRYNDYTHDPYSRCNCTPPYTAEAAISARGDLNPANGTYEMPGMGHANHAALDYKGTDYKMFKKLQFRAWSGPTYDDVPVFDWRDSDLAPTVKHFGQPLRWDFLPVDYEWETLLN
uniref:Phospholipase B-like n=1 Tax=Globodera rostochiensis TaxID=31243 RepID=A0A914GPK4_GLORO